MSFIEQISKQLPEFNGSNWLLRIPLAIVFIQMGLSKFPLDIGDAESFNLPMTVWVFVAWGELFSGFGLLIGGFLNLSKFLTTYRPSNIFTFLFILNILFLKTFHFSFS